jgi:hypothetical protein
MKPDAKSGPAKAGSDHIGQARKTSYTILTKKAIAQM